jgi:ankyrin repeat protein
VVRLAYLLVLVALPGPDDDLRDAVRDRDVDRVKSLLESGVDAITPYENGFTSIYFAGNPKIVDLLISHGAKLNIRYRALLQSPIEGAAEKADPNAFEEGGGFPIMVDAVKHPEVVKLLIEHGANLRRRITWHGGRTGIWIIEGEASALHYAVQEGNLESVKLLIAAGLDPNAADDAGQTPLHVAIRMDAFRHLNGQGGLGQNKTCSFDHIFANLLENDASVYFKDKLGRERLKLAESIKSSEGIRVLLRRKQAVIGAKFRGAMFDD